MTDLQTNSEIQNFLNRFETRFIRMMDSQWRLLHQTLHESYEGVFEWAQTPGGAGQVLNIQPQTQNFEDIHRVTAYIGSGQALLTLGNLQMPLPTGFSSFDVIWRVSNTDVRQVQTISGAVPPWQLGTATYMSVALTGKQIPIGGMRWG